jgi:hypothetical protein
MEPLDATLGARAKAGVGEVDATCGGADRNTLKHA